MRMILSFDIALYWYVFVCFDIYIFVAGREEELVQNKTEKHYKVFMVNIVLSDIWFDETKCMIWISCQW